MKNVKACEIVEGVSDYYLMWFHCGYQANFSWTGIDVSKVGLTNGHRVVTFRFWEGRRSGVRRAVQSAHRYLLSLHSGSDLEKHHSTAPARHIIFWQALTCGSISTKHRRCSNQPGTIGIPQKSLQNFLGNRWEFLSEKSTQILISTHSRCSGKIIQRDWRSYGVDLWLIYNRGVVPAD